MPQYIRHLPGKIINIIDKKTLPANNVVFNPSIAYPILYLRGTVKSKNNDLSYVLLYDYTTKKSHIIDSPPLERNINMYQGIEDLRICWHKDKLWFSGNSTHASKTMNNELVVGYFDKDFTKVEKISIVDISKVPVKNVCIFSHNDKLLLFDIYLKSIFILLEDSNTNEYIAIKEVTLKAGRGINIDHLRGSTSPVHLHGNTWGCVVHDIIFNDNTVLVTRLSYIHHWLEFDIESGVVTFVSSAFWVAHWGIEYVSGLKYDKSSDKIELFFGVEDGEAMSFHTTLSDMRIGK